jgi:hypothetical protein
MEPTTREDPAPELDRYQLTVRLVLLFVGLLDEKCLDLEHYLDRTRESLGLWATTSSVALLLVVTHA